MGYGQTISPFLNWLFTDEAAFIEEPNCGNVSPWLEDAHPDVSGTDVNSAKRCQQGPLIPEPLP